MGLFRELTRDYFQLGNGCFFSAENVFCKDTAPYLIGLALSDCLIFLIVG